jgi:hypothetical protein
LVPWISERPDEAIAQARDDTIERAKDIWGLDYAEQSDGLYPSGNQIGRSQYRPGHTRGQRGSAQIMPETIGGQWTTVFSALTAVAGIAVGDAVALGTTAQGLLTATLANYAAAGGAVQAWLDFILDEDMFVIHEGFFSRALEPSITEFTFVLSGVQIPTMQIEDIYVNEDSITKGYLEVPNVVSPKSQVVYRPRSRRVGLVGAGGGAAINVNDPAFDEDASIAEPFGIIGEAIAKRSFLIRELF